MSKRFDSYDRREAVYYVSKLTDSQLQSEIESAIAVRSSDGHKPGFKAGYLKALRQEARKRHGKENPGRRTSKRLRNFTGTITVQGGQVRVKGVQR